MRWPPSPPSCPVARAQLQHTCAAHPAEVQVWHGAPLLRAAGCFQCVSGVSTFLGILVRTRNCNGSQCADPRAHKETAMVRNQLTPKCNRSNRCSFTKTRPAEAGFPSVINCWILCRTVVKSQFSINIIGDTTCKLSPSLTHHRRPERIPTPWTAMDIDDVCNGHHSAF